MFYKKTLLIISLVLSFTFCSKKEEITDPTPEKPIVVDAENKEVRIATRLNRIWCDDSASIHNCIVYQNGIKAPKALFQAYCSHVDFFDALIDLGADPGIDIGDTPDSAAVATGSKLEVTFRWEGAPKSYTLNELVRDSLNRGFEIRMHNGKQRAIDMNMGCIMCYTACNISITSNTTYNWYEKMMQVYTFRPRAELLPDDSTLVIVTFKLVK
ncbi:MAG: YdjY domain-containing protein [candidate division WOR-3 bacterium]|nr:YdjY domain-containing protein [candidate division WOR-3 bacterium]